MRIPVKWLILSLAVLLVGCSGSSLYYSVALINKGQETVTVEPFALNEHETVLRDVLPLNADHGQAVFFYPPAKEINLVWSSSKTGVKVSTEVTINLPKEFTRENGSCINLYIDPEKQKIEVGYEILDPKTGDFNLVKQ